MIFTSSFKNIQIHSFDWSKNKLQIKTSYLTPSINLCQYLIFINKIVPFFIQLLMILIVLLAAFVLFLIIGGYVVIKLWGLTAGVKKIYDFVSFFRKGQRFDRVNSSNTQPYNKECPICLTAPQAPVCASCNHTYCSKCILQTYAHKGKAKLDCPMCRQPINILIRNFEPSTPVEQQLKIGICQYNKKHSTQSPFLRSIRQSVSMLPQIFNWVLSRQGISALYQNGRLKTIIFSLLYMMSPIDILPQALLGPLGLIDDSLVGMNIVRTLTNLFMDSVRNRDEAELRLFRQRQQQQTQPNIANILGFSS